MCDLVGKCRREILLELFGENSSSLPSSRESCCDVCNQSGEVLLSDRMKELEVLINALGDKGEVKLAQWIRGSFSTIKIVTPSAILWDTLKHGGVLSCGSAMSMV